MQVTVSNATHRRSDVGAGTPTVGEPVSTEAQLLVASHATVVLVQIDRGQEQLHLRLDPKLLADQQRMRRENEALEKQR